MAGAKKSTIAALPRLRRQVERAQASLARAEHELAVAERALELGSKNIHALDRALAQLDSQVDPLAGGLVNAWQGRYGERGALSQFLLDLLQKAAPSPMALHQIACCVESHFGIQHPDPKSRKKLRDSIRTCLRQLQSRKGRAKPHRPTPGHPAGYWVYQESTSLDKLREIANKVDEQEAPWP